MTLSVSKIITKIISLNGQSFVSNHKQGDLSELINGVDVFTINGCTNPKKLNKIKQVIDSNGFTCSKVNWEENAGFEGESADAINFSLIYVKN